MADCIEEDQEGMNFIYYPKVHITEGLMFPLLMLVNQFFHYILLHLVHTYVNVIRVLLRVCVLNHRFGIHLRLEEVLNAYTKKRHSFGKYYFMIDAKPLQLVINLPETSKNKPQLMSVKFI